MKINSITTKDDEKINLGQLTILIGPNNSGKTTTLSEINQIIDSGYTPERVLLEKLEFQEIFLGDFSTGLDIKTNPVNTSQHIARGLVSNLGKAHAPAFVLQSLEDNLPRINDNGWQNIVNMGLGPLKVTMLDSGRRLLLANETREGRGTVSPLNELYAKKKVEPILEDAFEKAFGMKIKLDFSSREVLRFRVSDEFEKIPPDPRDQTKIMEKYPTLDIQGEGFRSFVGIILGIILSEGRIVLINEPEAFLHPTQSRILGEWIANYSQDSETQIIIATHSADILDGLLQKHEDAIILRVDRTGNTTKYHRLSSSLTQELAQKPLVSSQPVLEALFYKGVIVAEGDSDRIIYKSVYSKNYDKREHLFLNTIGKQNVKKIISSLKGANVPVCAVVDIDVLDDHTIFKDLVKSFESEIEINNLLKIRDDIAKAVEGVEQSDVLEEMKKSVKAISQKLETGCALNDARKELNKLHARSGKWRNIKKNGIDGLPENVKEDTRLLLEQLKSIGLFVVPVGELESWIPLENVSWVETALDKITSGDIPGKLRNFISEIIEFLEKQL